MECEELNRAAAGGAEGDVRVLRRLEIREGFTGRGVDEGASVAAVVDVETTGLDHDGDAVIQLAMRRFRFDADGEITRIGPAFSWFEDPGRPIPVEITRLTGITDADVAGRRFNDDDVVWALTHAGVVVAHNASFDRKWIERRFPAAAGLAWACSMADVDWRRFGLDGRALGFLGMQCGFFYEAHRAEVDVDAVVALLGHRFDDGRTDGAVSTDGRVAVGAAFAVKERLRARGFRWDPRLRVWAKEVRDGDRLAEEFWLAANVYRDEARPMAPGPTFERRTSRERYA